MRCTPDFLLAVLASCTFSLGVATGAQVRFTEKPTARQTEGKVKITFALSAPTDVEVAVLDGKGEVIRHLAAGMLGSKSPPPKPLKLGLRQSLAWDGKDDMGKPVRGRSWRIRVRAGTQVSLGGVIGDPGILESKLHGLATDAEGFVYVATGGGYGKNLYTIKVFERSGKYARTIMPYPANLKLNQVQGFARQTRRDGRLNPPQFNMLLPWIYPGGLGGLMGNGVQNGVLWLTNGKGELCRIDAQNGMCISWGGTKRPAPPAQGPVCWGVSPGGKTLYLAGWYFKRKQVADGQVWKVNPTTGQRAPFIKIDVPADSFWLTEKNGWYNYTNWGRKNGMSAIHGLAVDEQGRIYACDRVNQRLAVYDAAGILLGHTAVEWPDHVALSPDGPEIYVTTRKVIDGYKAINEVSVIKLSGWKNGKVLARLTLQGQNAPSMAVDATAKPAVIWLSNVAVDREAEAILKKKKQIATVIARIEDRGKRFVVTGKLGDAKTSKMPSAVAKVWADPQSDDIVVNNAWSGLSRFDGVTGEALPFPLKGMDLCFGRDGYIYVYGQKGWHELVTRFDRNYKPAPFKASGKNTTTRTTTGKDVYGRYGHGWSNKGLAVAPDGRILVYNMYDWAKYFINAWDPTGRAEKHARVGDGLLGPLDPQGGGVRVDFRGNIYVGMHGAPASHPKPDKHVGTIVKFTPAGGGYVALPSGKKGIAWQGSNKGKYLEGGLTVYPGLGAQVDRGCVCREGRFDLDGYGRLYVPNAREYCVRVYDNAGNLIVKFGYYANPDSYGKKSPVPEPEIPLGWPMSVSAGQIHKGRLYVADTLNHRIVNVQVSHAAETTCSIRRRH